MSSTLTSVRTFAVDKSHSEASFAVRHLIAKVRGRFRDFAGAIDFDEAQPDRSSVSFTIQAASIDTNEPDRDRHLRSADFFDVERTPTISFKSSRVAVAGPDAFDVTGTLTMHGVAREIVLPVIFLGIATDPAGNERVGFEIALTLNRKEFGLNWNAALEVGGFLVGDEVQVSLSVQAIGQA